MSNETSKAPVAVSIDDLGEVVGGVAFKVNPLLEMSLQEPLLAMPVTNMLPPNFSTCMCPSSKHNCSPL